MTHPCTHAHTYSRARSTLGKGVLKHLAMPSNHEMLIAKDVTVVVFITFADRQAGRQTGRQVPRPRELQVKLSTGLFVTEVQCNTI